MRSLLVALGVLVLAGTFGGVAGAHRDPCHSQHRCPSDHHTYAWQGLSCTSYPDERLPGDTRKVVVDGRAYWCHPDTSATPGPGDSSAQPDAVNVPVVTGLRTITTKVAISQLS